MERKYRLLWLRLMAFQEISSVVTEWVGLIGIVFLGTLQMVQAAGVMLFVAPPFVER